MLNSQLKDAGKLLLKIFIFIIILFVCDRLIGKKLDKKYDETHQGNISVIGHVIQNPTEDMFIYGPSLAVHGMKPDIFTDTLGYSCYNAGRESSQTQYAYITMQWSLKKHIPKLIVLVTSPKELQWRASETPEKILSSMLLPYVSRDTSFRNMAAAMLPTETRLAGISKLYGYNSLILPVMMHFGLNGAKMTDIKNGYQPFFQHIKDSKIPTYEFQNPDMHEATRQKFEQLVQMVHDYKIPLIVVEAPLYIHAFPDTKSETEMKRVTTKYNVPFWSFVSDTSFQKQNYFHDNIHMTDEGATAFSKVIALRIKQYLQQQDSVPKKK